MSFIDKFKINFSQKAIQSYIKDDNAMSLFTELLELLNKEPKLTYDFIYQNVDQIISTLAKQDLLPQNILWVNSFDPKHTKYLESFLKYYFQHNDADKEVYFNSLENELFNILKHYKKNIDLSFSNYILESDFYQLLVSLIHKEKYIFLNNQMVFYEHSSGRKFTNLNFTRAYIYLVKNPYVIYDELKKNKENLFAQDYLMNLDQKPIVKELEQENVKFRFEINRQSWSTNISSWDNYNVMNTFRGFVVKTEDLSDEPFDHLANIIAHVIQSGINVKLNYKTIEEFIKNTEQPIMKNLYKLSNKEKKFFARDISPKATDYNYLDA